MIGQIRLALANILPSRSRFAGCPFPARRGKSAARLAALALAAAAWLGAPTEARSQIMCPMEGDLHFRPDTVMNQVWAVGETVDLPLPIACVGDKSTTFSITNDPQRRAITYKLDESPELNVEGLDLPPGLSWDAASRRISGTARVPMESRRYLYTAFTGTGELVRRSCRPGRFCPPPRPDILEVVTLRFTLEVRDATPVADAGADRTVPEGETVMLDGSESWNPNPKSGRLTYKWTAPDEVMLDDAAAETPTFTAPTQLAENLELTFSLVVTDAAGVISDLDEVKITVTAGPNDAPTAFAGDDRTFEEGATVTLDGSGHDPEGEVLTYEWTPVLPDPFPAGVTLDGADTATPTFTAPTQLVEDLALTFSLVVTDGRDLSSTNDARVRIWVRAGRNDKPTAVAKIAASSPTAFVEGGTVTLDGTESRDPEGEELTYAWRAPAGFEPFRSTEATPTFTAPVELAMTRDVVFSLTVTDTRGRASDAAEVTVTSVAGPNAPPTAVARLRNPGQTTVAEGEFVPLDGTKSTDPESVDRSVHKFTYAWSGVSPDPFPEEVRLFRPTTARPSFRAPTQLTEDLELTFELAVTDIGGATATDRVTVTVRWGDNLNVNDPPTANAGEDRIVAKGELVGLDGTKSRDPEGEELTYAWTAPRGVTLDDATLANPTFTTPRRLAGDGRLVFSLMVTDASGVSSVTPDEVTITVEAVNPQVRRTVKEAVNAMAAAVGWGDVEAVRNRINDAAVGTGIQTSGVPTPVRRETSARSLGLAADDAAETATAAELLERGASVAVAVGASDSRAPANRFGAWVAVGRTEVEAGGDRRREGRVTSLRTGVDAKLAGGTTVGLGGGWHRGEIDFTDGGSDTVDEVGMEMITLTPYVGHAGDRTTVWGALSVGTGDADHVERGLGLTSNLRSYGGAAGLEARGAWRGFELAGRGEGMYSRVEIDADAASSLDDTSTTAAGLRAELEAGLPQQHEGYTFRPYATAGVRHDLGDYASGLALEVGGGLDLLRGEALRLTLSGRTQLGGDLELSSYGVSGYYDPGGDSMGLMLGVDGNVGGQALDTFGTGPVALGDDPGRFGFDVGYGLPAGRGVLTPYTRLSLSDGAVSSTEGGLKWTRRGVDVGARHRFTPDTDGGGDHSLGVTLDLRF